MSATTNLKLFKHDNPSTNTDQFDVDKALNENWDKIDKGIEEDREKITTLEEETVALKQENAELKQNLDNVLISRTSRRWVYISRR